jgi:RNA polymerase sigma-70 factor (ECF subfamily)
MVLDGTSRETIEAFRRGDPDAFRALFEAHKDRVYSIALRYSGDPAAAMDIAQDVFLKLYSSIGDFRGDASLDTWLYRVVVNRCVDYRRSTVRRVPFVGDLIEAGESVLSRLVRAEEAQGIEDAVAKLPADQRIVVVLRYTEGRSYEEIAEILNCSRGTVASRLSRAHKALERRLSHLKKSPVERRSI